MIEKEVKKLWFVRDKLQKPIQIRHSVNADSDVNVKQFMASRLFECHRLLSFMKGSSYELLQDLRAAREENFIVPEIINIEIWEMQSERYLWQHVGWEKIEGFEILRTEHSDPEDSACCAYVDFNYKKYTSGQIENGKIVDMRVLEVPKYPWMKVKDLI